GRTTAVTCSSSSSGRWDERGERRGVSPPVAALAGLRRAARPGRVPLLLPAGVRLPLALAPPVSPLHPLLCSRGGGPGRVPAGAPGVVGAGRSRQLPPVAVVQPKRAVGG